MAIARRSGAARNATQSTGRWPMPIVDDATIIEEHRTRARC